MRRKSTKQYAIRLTHPEFGEYYFNYDNNDYYGGNSIFMFTQTLTKVNKWKTLKIVENYISIIKDKLDRKSGKILLPFGDNVDSIAIELKNKMILNRKRYFFPISGVVSKTHLVSAKSNIERLNTSLVDDTKNILKLIKNSKQVEKDFMNIFHKLEDDINLYRKDFGFLQKNIKIGDVVLDIVDASYGFRLLKLKTLRDFKEEENIEEIK